jgi:hypothetical protein
LIELDDFIDNKIDTAWLDEIIKLNVEGIGGMDSEKDGSLHKFVKTSVKRNWF